MTTMPPKPLQTPATPADGRGDGDDVKVRSLDYWARKYNFPPPDEFVGPDSGRFVLDYGRPPIVVADSARGARRSWLEQLLRRRIPNRD